jgi:hypothetical protein
METSHLAPNMPSSIVLNREYLPEKPNRVDNHLRTGRYIPVALGSHPLSCRAWKPQAGICCPAPMTPIATQGDGPAPSKVVLLTAVIEA